MKNFLPILLLAGMTLITKSISAQPQAGIKAGINAASLSSYEGNSRISFHAGFFAGIKLQKKWRLNYEIIYSGEGQQYSFEESKRTIAIGYAQLPLMIHFQAAEKFYLEAGPQLGFLVHASSSGDDLAKLNVKRSFNNTQFAMNMGAGVNINSRYSFYGRYQVGISDVTIGSIIDKSRVIMVGLSYKFKNSSRKDVVDVPSH
jgi:hypothetical protein